MKELLILFFFVLFFPFITLAEEYDATVTTESGTYTVPVEVGDGDVAYVYWPNGGDMHVYGAEIEDGQASGTNSRGDSIEIEVDHYEESEE